MKIGRIPIVMDLQKRFRGCLLGGLTGDCLGAPFEGDKMTAGSKLVLHNYMDKLYGEYTPGELRDIYIETSPVKNYTDDTAMTKAIANSLIENEGFDAKDMAQKFVNEFYSDPGRGYGEAIPKVFDKLRKQRYSNLYDPAQQQFGGSGSYGNGGAMRIAPIALFYHKNFNKMIEVATNSTKLTHANIIGVNGALLQCIAIQQCLLLKNEAKEPLNQLKFIEDITTKIESLESVDSDMHDLKHPYKNQLHEVKILLENPDIAYDEKVINKLGNRIVALYSVPTAIYCFLRASQPMKEIKVDNPVRRATQYAISLGGDTDTIACMAGSLAGAYYGDYYFNESIRKHCESSEDILKSADKLFHIMQVQYPDEKKVESDK